MHCHSNEFGCVWHQLPILTRPNTRYPPSVAHHDQLMRTEHSRHARTGINKSCSFKIRLNLMSYKYKHHRRYYNHTQCRSLRSPGRSSCSSLTLMRTSWPGTVCFNSLFFFFPLIIVFLSFFASSFTFARHPSSDECRRRAPQPYIAPTVALESRLSPRTAPAPTPHTFSGASFPYDKKHLRHRDLLVVPDHLHHDLLSGPSPAPFLLPRSRSSSSSSRTVHTSRSPRNACTQHSRRWRTAAPGGRLSVPRDRVRCASAQNR